MKTRVAQALRADGRDHALVHRPGRVSVPRRRLPVLAAFLGTDISAIPQPSTSGPVQIPMAKDPMKLRIRRAAHAGALAVLTALAYGCTVSTTACACVPPPHAGVGVVVGSMAENARLNVSAVHKPGCRGQVRVAPFTRGSSSIQTAPAPVTTDPARLTSFDAAQPGRYASTQQCTDAPTETQVET